MLTNSTAESNTLGADYDARGHRKIEYRFRESTNMFAMYDRGMRRGGETIIEGVPLSTIRNPERKLTVVPAGHDFRDLHEESTLTRMMWFYFDPAALRVPSNAGFGEMSPRLLFEDRTLWATALKLKRAIESHEPGNQLYAESLAIVLMHELLHRESRGISRGGDFPWRPCRLAKAQGHLLY